MTVLEHVNDTGQTASVIASSESQFSEEGLDQAPPAIGSLLRSLRGDRTLRQVEAETGVSNAYLCNIEGSLKRPGVKTLSKLAMYYQVPLQDLLEATGLIHPQPVPKFMGSTGDVQRSYDFVMADPAFIRFRKPTETPPTEFQMFVVQIYEHYTGKKLL